MYTFTYSLNKIIIRKSFAKWSIILTVTLYETSNRYILFLLLLPAYKIPSIPKSNSDNLAT